MDGKIGLEEHWAIPDTLGDSESLVGTSAGWDNVRRRLLDIQDERLREMDSHGIELTILSLNAPALQAILDPSEAIETARKANDIMAGEVAKRRDRFRGFAALPMQDVDAAIAELQRCVKDLGFVGALVNGFTQRLVEDSAVYFDIPEYRPFWAALEELDVPFYLHPRTQIAARMQPYEGHPWLISAAWGFARETSTGMVIFSILGCGVSLLFAIITSQLWIAMTFLTFVGVFMLIGNVGAQSLIQNTVDQEVRARVLGLFIVFAHGLPAVGAVVMGWIASVAGLPMTIGIGALLMVLVWLWARPQSANMADVLERPEPG